MAGAHLEASDQEILAFRAEAQRKVDEDREMVKVLRRNPRGFLLATIVSIIILVIISYFILALPLMLYVWLIAALLLYSYNFIILIIPTTTERRAKMSEYVDFGSSFKDLKELVVHLIMKRRRLAIEIGLTVFLSGMVPLALSFYIIFGIGMAFTIYFGLVTGSIDFHSATTVILQLVLIIGFLTMMVLLEPQAQGITRIAKSMQVRIRRARIRGGTALTLIAMVVVGIVTLSAVLIVGAVLVPGGTLIALLEDLMLPAELGALLIIAMITGQAFVMRHFQVFSSRRMAANLLEDRADRIESEIIAPLDGAIAGKVGDECLLLENIKAKFYSWVIYDVVEQNLFGYSPIYLVAPNMGYIHNEKILDYVYPSREVKEKTGDRTGTEQASSDEVRK